MRKHRSRQREDAELEITSFMNLMIVLVPVLLMGLVFSQTTVLELTLPPAAIASEQQGENKTLELVIRQDGMSVNYPQGITLKSLPLTAEGKQDFKTLSVVMQEVKRQLREQSIDKRAITILSEREISYQTLVSAMDTVRSFKAVVVADVVDAELFPEISFGDAPLLAGAGGGS